MPLPRRMRRLRSQTGLTPVCESASHYESAVFIYIYILTPASETTGPRDPTPDRTLWERVAPDRSHDKWSVSVAQAGAPSLQRGSHALWPQRYGGPLAASMACGARDRMIRAGLRATRRERSHDQGWAAPCIGSDGSCPTVSPSAIDAGSLGPSCVIRAGTHGGVRKTSPTSRRPSLRRQHET